MAGREVLVGRNLMVLVVLMVLVRCLQVHPLPSRRRQQRLSCLAALPQFRFNSGLKPQRAAQTTSHVGTSRGLIFISCSELHTLFPRRRSCVTRFSRRTAPSSFNSHMFVAVLARCLQPYTCLYVARGGPPPV